jgi:uncharacterized RDD family membrane protein YckC
MAVDPNDTARQAFGYAPAPPAAPAPLSASRAPDVRELADWWTRVGAFLLDQLVIGGVAAVVAIATLIAAGDADSRTAELVVYAVAIPIGLLYAPLLMARRGARNGQTWGKQAVGIRVVRTGGGPVTFWNGVLRSVIGQQLLTAVTFYVYALLDYLWPLRDARNQALHDKLAKTLVVRADASSTTTVPLGAWLPPQAPGA